MYRLNSNPTSTGRVWRSMSATRASIIVSLLAAWPALIFSVAGAQETVAPPTNVSADQYGFTQSVRISWVASATSSVNIYRVYRSATGGSLGEPLGAVSGLEFVD